MCDWCPSKGNETMVDSLWLCDICALIFDDLEKERSE